MGRGWEGASAAHLRGGPARPCPARPAPSGGCPGPHRAAPPVCPPPGCGFLSPFFLPFPPPTRGACRGPPGRRLRGAVRVEQRGREVVQGPPYIGPAAAAAAAHTMGVPAAALCLAAALALGCARPL